MVILSKSNKQVFLLFLSTILGTLLGVLSSIINTRFLIPEAYGDVRYVQNVINFISSILLFGYFLSGSRLLAISDDETCSKKIRGSLLVILGICSAILILSMCVCSVLKNSESSISYLFLVSMPVCTYPLLLNYINTVSQGDNHIGRISLARVLPTFVYIPFAWYIYSASGATPEKMVLLQWGIYTVILLCIILSCKYSFYDLRPTFKALNAENKKYGFQLYLGSLIMVASNYIAGITIGLFGDNNTEVGFYTLALTVTSPLAMLPGIIGTTYFKQFARQAFIPHKVMKWSILLTVASCILFILVIKWVVILLYSEDYAPVGGYAVWLAAGFSIHGFGDMINRYLGSHGQGKSIRNSSIANGVFKIFGFTVLVYYFGVYGALATSVICSTIYTLTLLYYYTKFVNNK